MQNDQAHQGYTVFYENIALYPEGGRFRRFAGHWAKKLYDDTKELIQRERILNNALADIPDVGSTVLQCPRSRVDSVEHGEAHKAWIAYEGALMTYGQSLVLSHQVMNLPHQSPYHTKHLADFKPHIFEAGVFNPTEEQAAIYQGPSHRTDTCAWRTIPQNDPITRLIIHNSRWIQERVLNRVLRIGTRRKPWMERDTDVRHDIIVGIMDISTCIFVSLLLTAAMFALASINPLKTRIGVAGAFGTIFSLSVKVIAGHPTRSEVFAATAAFFAVASVFVGSTNNDCDGH